MPDTTQSVVPKFSWDLPYSSRRMPILANNAVSTSHPLAAQAGLYMLQRGGSAADAIIATAIAMTVLEPVSNGIGSDAFALLWDGKELHGLNASGRAPAAWTPQYFAGHKTFPQRGWNSVNIPGAVSAWVAIHGRFGKLPFGDLFEPAIRYARDGVMIAPVLAHKWVAQVPILKDQPGFAECFMPRGRAPAAGERFTAPEMAATLTKIAASGGEAFYRGELAEKMAAHSKANGGAMALNDLSAHTADWVEPISGNYRGYTLHEIPPSGQGIAALIALGIVDQLDLLAYKVDSADSQHLQIEAMKLAFADTYRYVSDPSSMKATPAQMLDRAYLKSRAAMIDLKRAQDFKHGTPPSGGTVYLTAADAGGMMVSYIQSNYQGFGSGVVVPGTGISLQNRGFGFTLEPGHANQVAPGKRPFHTIIPAFLSKDGEPVMSFGVMGGNMQPQGHLQMMTRLLAYGQNPQAACDAPRWKVNTGLGVEIEGQMNMDVTAELIRRGHRVETIYDPYMDFGAGQFILKMQDGYLAASDSRRDGQAVGF
jgi:gamma-glutamyltranspeptidase / glutathione hydrolase